MKKQIVLGAVLALATSVSAPIEEAKAAPGQEKCYGVVKAGKNDCGNLSGTHSCAGNAKIDGDPGEWLYVPKGMCEKLVNGEVKG